MLDMRSVALAISCAVLGACDLGETTRGDELDQPGSSAVAWDGGPLSELFVPIPSAPPIPEPEPSPHHDCHDPCPEVCNDGEACCRSTQQCIALECRECCPDADFGFAELMFGGR